MSKEKLPTKYMAFDCETTGLDPLKSELLTVHVRFLDRNLELVSHHSIKTKPSGLYLIVDPEAIRINKIDLYEHVNDPATMEYREAGEYLRRLIRSQYTEEQLRKLDDKKLNFRQPKIEPIGQQVDFDVDFLEEKLMPDFELLISRKRLDTAVIANWLKLTGHIPEDMSISLVSLAKFYGVEYSTAHDAMEDTIVTVEILKRMKHKASIPDCGKC